MKGDLSRRTFQAAKHYRSVDMQQGRVQLDADWNEQIDITGHRVETEAFDVIGDAGGPQANAGFAITGLPAADVRLGAGRYYVDGILVVNERAVPYTAQPDHPGFAPLRAGDPYLVYLDVWHRHTTALDDPHVREVALGGPDTATRSRTTWQVKVAATTASNCIDGWAAFLGALAPSGAMRAGTEPVVTGDNPCLVRPMAGYRGLENQLYRIEIHTRGNALELAAATAHQVTFDLARPNEVTAAGGTWTAGGAVQITSTAHPDEGPVFVIRSVAGQVLALHAEVRGVVFDGSARLRPIPGPVFKWSRDNAAIATRIQSITGARLVVESLGPDDVLGFRDGDLVELSDDHHELGGPGPADARPGELLQIKKVYPGTRTVELVAPPAFVLHADRHPKLRKWHGLGAVVAHDADPERAWVELELGLRVRFTKAGLYRTADYWQVAARASNADSRSGNIEWPFEVLDQPPFGIGHHYCPLGMVRPAALAADAQIEDCRDLFPPLTELKRLSFVGGDGQEVMPDLTVPGSLAQLAHELVVGVANGLKPVAGAYVAFEIVEGDPVATGDQISVPGGATADGRGGRLVTTTAADGTARCTWRLRSATGGPRQVRAQLLDPAQVVVPVPPVLFGASRSIASQVAFLPPIGCASLTGQKTVQAALETLAHVRSLIAIGGDGQWGAPGSVLGLPLEIEVRDHCGPVDARVELAVTSGGLGDDPTVASPLTSRIVSTGVDGRAIVYWRLGPARGPQQVTATLLDGPLPALSVRFTANAVSAGCEELVARTVRELVDIFEMLPPGADAHVCIVPGRFVIEQTIVVSGKGHLKISGAGDATELLGVGVEQALRFEQCDSVTIRDLRIAVSSSLDPTHEGGALDLEGCGRVTLEHLRVGSIPARDRAAACLSVRACPSVRIRSCDLVAGDGGIGIRVIDAERAELEDNTLEVDPGKPRTFRDKLRDGGRYVDGVNKYLMHPTQISQSFDDGWPTELEPVKGILYVTALPKRVLAAVGGDPDLARLILDFITRERGTTMFPAEWRLSYFTPTPLLEPWQALLAERPLPPNVPVTAGTLKAHVRSLGNQIIGAYAAGNTGAFSPRFTEALDLLGKEARAAGAQGIVVGGTVRGEVRILDNTITGFVMGIHVGHSGEPRRTTYRSGRTLIHGNTVIVRVNGEHWNDRHGVFSGNSENTIIENNTVTADRTPMAMDLPLEGYRIYGIFGPMLAVHQNQAVDCSVGFRVQALNPGSQPASIWRVHDNAVRGTFTPFDIAPAMP